MSAKKYIVHMPRGMAPRQIDDFPKGCKRSVKGSLRMAPGILELTEDELKHLRKHHKDLGRRLRLVGPSPPPAKATPTPKPAPEPALAANPAPTEDTTVGATSVEAPKAKAKGKSSKGK